MNMSSGDEKETGAVVVQSGSVSLSQGYKGNWKNIVFNEVEIGEQIGGGSVGLIYRGYYQGKNVALKTLVSTLTSVHGLMSRSCGHGTTFSKRGLLGLPICEAPHTNDFSTGGHYPQPATHDLKENAPACLYAFTHDAQRLVCGKAVLMVF